MFEPLKNIVARVAANRNFASTFTAAEVCAAAQRIIAAELPQLSARFRVKFLQKDTLHIAVDSSAVGSELNLASQTILTEIQKRYPAVKKLRSSIGPIDLREPC
jgi:hypothetical protein